MEDDQNKHESEWETNDDAFSQANFCEQQNTEENDKELAELLDSAEEDFARTAEESRQTAGEKPLTELPTSSEPGGATGGVADPAQEAAFNEIFTDQAQKQFEDMMKALMGENKGIYENIEKLASVAAQSDEGVENQQQFEKTLEDTMKSMAQNTQQLQNDIPEEELLKILGGLGLGAEGSAGPEDMGDFMPMMQTMMKSILSKDVLYPSLKDISEKYPTYLENNRSKISEKDLENYTKQYEIMKRICDEFEQETDTDSEAVKEKRMETIMDLMENMRQYGQPPTELVGEMPPGFDSNMFGGFPTTPEQCSVM